MSDHPAGFAVMPIFIARDPTIDTSTKTLLLVLSSYANAEQACWPGKRALAEATGLSESTIRRLLRSAEERGLVETSVRFDADGSMDTNRYRLTFGKWGGAKTTPPVHPRLPPLGTHAHPPCASTPTPPVHPCTPNNTNEQNHPNMTTVSSAQLSLVPPQEPEVEQPKPKTSRFQKPDAEQVAAELAKRGMPTGVATQKAGEFIDHYESNGWKVGKTPMKSWKAACGTWVRNWQQNQQKRGLVHGGRAFHQTTREEAERLNRENWGGDAPKW